MKNASPPERRRVASRNFLRGKSKSLEEPKFLSLSFCNKVIVKKKAIGNPSSTLTIEKKQLVRRPASNPKATILGRERFSNLMIREQFKKESVLEETETTIRVPDIKIKERRPEASPGPRHLSVALFKQPTQILIQPSVQVINSRPQGQLRGSRIKECLQFGKLFTTHIPWPLHLYNCCSSATLKKAYYHSSILH